jgi:hypothetical protein
MSRLADSERVNPAWAWKTKSDAVDVGNLNENIINYLSTLETEYQNLIFATAGRDGVHGTHSRHYKGNAVDLRIHNKKDPLNDKLYKRISKDLKRRDFGIVVVDPRHGNAPHIHLSYGTQGTEQKHDVAKFYSPDFDEQKFIAENGIPLNSTQTPTKEVVAAQEDFNENSKYVEDPTKYIPYPKEGNDLEEFNIPEMKLADLVDDGSVEYDLEKLRIDIKRASASILKDKYSTEIARKIKERQFLSKLV